MRGRQTDGMRAEGLEDRAGDGYGTTRWWREQSLLHQCVCMRVHVLPVALQSDFTPLLHPREKRAGVRALGSAPALPWLCWHWLCDFCIYVTLSAPARSLVEQGNYSERLT